MVRDLQFEGIAVIRDRILAIEREFVILNILSITGENNMASIVLELQKLAANPNSNVEELLNMTLIVARKLKLDNLRKWCDLELQGYYDNLSEIPKYRKFNGQLKVDTPLHGYLPLYAPDEINNELTHTEIICPISEIQNYINSGAKTFEKPLPNDVRKLIKENQKTPYPLEPKVTIESTQFQNILSCIRQVILNWALTLEEEGVLGEGIQFSLQEQAKAMSTQFHIQNMQGFVGNISGGNMQQNIHDGIHIETNNFDQLADVLSKNGIPFSELSSLKEAIDLDEKPTEANKFGTNVSQWIGNIMTKASSGAINVSLATIAGLLTNAISKYYGLN